MGFVWALALQLSNVKIAQYKNREYFESSILSSSQIAALYRQRLILGAAQLHKGRVVAIPFEIKIRSHIGDSQNNVKNMPFNLRAGLMDHFFYGNKTVMIPTLPHQDWVTIAVVTVPFDIL